MTATADPSQVESPVFEIRPQPGPQTAFLASDADIVIYGGAGGGGKTWGALLECLRHSQVKGFHAVVFRRTSIDITNAGALWDQSCELYPLAGGLGSRHNTTWRWPIGAKIQFSHMEHENDRFNWMGAQIALIVFEELTHFTAKQFWYMLSRNRSTCGVRPYMRATCNPDPDHFVAQLIEWWLDPDTGLPIPERSGVVRWLARVGDDIQWGGTREELVERYGSECEPVSFTFIAANVFDNKILLEKNPEYLSKLKNLPRVDRERLLGGNWKVRETAGTMFRAEWFRIVEAIPAATKKVRTWDLAGSEPTPSTPDPDWTVGLKMSRADSGLFCIEHMVRIRKTSGVVMTTILNTASQDGRGVTIRIVHDPGQSGKHQAHDYAVALAGYDVVLVPQNRTKGDKVTHAKPASRQAENGNITIFAGVDHKTIISELVNFPEGKHDDITDTLADGVIALTSAPELRVSGGSSSTTDPKKTAAKSKAEVEREFFKKAEQDAARIAEGGQAHG